jgi:hypothetical protein
LMLITNKALGKKGYIYNTLRVVVNYY